MNSKEQIKYNLEQIAKNRNLSGEAVDLIIDLLTYALYHEQVEIANTAKEMSLNDAVLVNSKIALCCNNMYSVYRGKNPRLKLKIKVNSVLNKNRFDKIYESNSFKVYCNRILSINPSPDPIILGETLGEDGKYHDNDDLIISKDDIIQQSYTIDNIQDTYYIDIIDPTTTNHYSNLSEDIIVGIEDGNTEYTEYKTTRIFSDHCKSFGSNEKIFVLTIPDYGIRLYKKDRFVVNSRVYVKVFKYTTLDDINESELNKIVIPGTETLVYSETTGLKYDIVDTIRRQDLESLQYEVNLAGRVNHEIQSNSDVSYLFNEVFIDKVIMSAYKYVADEVSRSNDKLFIWYILKPGAEITDQDQIDFKTQYCSYFVCEQVEIIEATEVPVVLELDVVTDDTSENIYDQVQSILNEYTYKLGMKLNKELLISQISKIDTIKYVQNLDYDTTVDHDFDIGCLSELDSSYGIETDEEDPIMVPDQYYTITPNINFIQE